MHRSIFTIIFIYLHISVFAQHIKIELESFICPLQSSSQCDSILLEVEKAFNLYIRYASLIDESAGEISSDAGNRFSSLFTNGKSTHIFGDLLNQPENISVQDYLEFAFFKLKNNGVKFRIDKVTCINLEEHEHDPSLLKVTLLVEKVMLNQWNHEKRKITNQIKYFSKPLTFIYEVPKVTYQKIKISNIHGPTCIRYKSQPIIEMYGGASLLILSQISKRGFKNNLLVNSTQRSGGLNFKQKFNFKKSPLPSRLSYLIGLEYSQATFNLFFDDFHLKEISINDNSLLTNGIEKYSYKALNSIIGIGSNVITKRRMKVSFDLIFLSTYLVTSKNHFSGTIEKIPDTTFSILKQPLENKHSIQHSFRLAPKLYWQLKERWGLSTALLFSIPLNNIWEKKIQTNLFSDFTQTLNKTQVPIFNEGISQTYFKSHGISFWGIQLGVFYLFQKEKLSCPN